MVDEEISDGVKIGRSRLRQLAQVLERLRDLFDGPQDCEWGEVDDVLVLFQCRPVTTTITGTPHGPVFGPGPVSETFPDPPVRWRSTCGSTSPLRPHRGVEDLRGRQPRHLAERELVTAVDGLVAVDLRPPGTTPEPDLDGSAVVAGAMSTPGVVVADRPTASGPSLGGRRGGRCRRRRPGDRARRVHVERSPAPSSDRPHRPGLRCLHAHEILLA
ncbi:MAG: hypothetical protein IPG97_03085 [Microthrixaceae bacterium]|nr:hypothetical protein [Microthrixaceae bacterium]